MKRNDGHFLGWGDNPKAPERDPDPADAGDLDPRAGAAPGLAST